MANARSLIPAHGKGNLADLKNSQLEAKQKAQQALATLKQSEAKASALYHKVQDELTLLQRQNTSLVSFTPELPPEQSPQFEIMRTRVKALADKLESADAKAFFQEFVATFGELVLPRSDAKFKNDLEYESYLKTYLVYVIDYRMLQPTVTKFDEVSVEFLTGDISEKTIAQQVILTTQRRDYYLTYTKEFELHKAFLEKAIVFFMARSAGTRLAAAKAFKNENAVLYRQRSHEMKLLIDEQIKLAKLVEPTIRGVPSEAFNLMKDELAMLGKNYQTLAAQAFFTKLLATYGERFLERSDPRFKSGIDYAIYRTAWQAYLYDYRMHDDKLDQLTSIGNLIATPGFTNSDIENQIQVLNCRGQFYQRYMQEFRLQEDFVKQTVAYYKIKLAPRVALKQAPVLRGAVSAAGSGQGQHVKIYSGASPSVAPFYKAAGHRALPVTDAAPAKEQAPFKIIVTRH